MFGEIKRYKSPIRITANAFISFLPAERQVRSTIRVSQLILKNLCLLTSTYIYWRRSIISVKIFRNLYKSKGRWIRPLLLLTQRTHPPRSGQILESSSAIESLEVEFASELNKFLASPRILVASLPTRVKFVVWPRIPQRLPRPAQINIHTLLDNML